METATAPPDADVEKRSSSSSPASSAPSSPEQPAKAETFEEEDSKGFVVLGPSTLNLHQDSHRFSYRQSTFDFSIDGIATVAELELRPNSGEHEPDDHNTADWELVLTLEDNDGDVNGGGGDESDRIVIPLPFAPVAPPPQPAQRSGVVNDVIARRLVEQAFSLVGRRANTSAELPPAVKTNPLTRRVILADHGVEAGRYLASLSIGGLKVGTEPKSICPTDQSARADDEPSNDLLRMLEEEALKGQRWAEWLSGGEVRKIACTEVWPAAPSLNEAEAVSVLRAARVHSDCFFDAGRGITVAEHGGILYLHLPVDAEQVCALRDRLVSTVTHARAAAATHPPQPWTAKLLSAKVSAKAVFFAACISLCWYQRSVAPLLLAACVQSAGFLLKEMSACERKWVDLEQQFAAWSQQHQQHAAMTSAQLQQLLSRDGPWRGNYEACLSTTRAQAGAAASQAAALALLLSAGWLAAELFFFTPSSPSSEAELVLAAAVAGGAVVAVLWMAAGLTARVQDQSTHLYEIHRLAVEVIARELAAADSSDRTAIMSAKVEFEMEYGLVKVSEMLSLSFFSLFLFLHLRMRVDGLPRQAQDKRKESSKRVGFASLQEFMALNGAVDGCTILECRVTRSHALTATTMLLPALVKELDAEVLSLLCTTGWICVCATTCASAFAVLASDAQIWLSPSWMAITDVKELLAASRRVVVASCKQGGGTLAVVMLAVLVRAALQLRNTAVVMPIAENV